MRKFYPNMSTPIQLGDIWVMLVQEIPKKKINKDS